jgi:large subunit ribosomal protein L23
MKTMKTKTNPIMHPRITEKASTVSGQNVYTFDVSPRTNKTEIKKAIFEIYKVRPTKVNVLSVPRKHVFTKGKQGVRGGGRKALVYLKEGDKIEFV